MADWSDLVGRTLQGARERAETYDADVAVVMIGQQRQAEDPAAPRPYSRQTVQVSVDAPGPEAIVVAVLGDEAPDRR